MSPPAASHPLLSRLGVALLAAGAFLALGAPGARAAENQAVSGSDAQRGGAAASPDASAAQQPGAAAAQPSGAVRAGASASRAVTIVDFAFDPTAITVHSGDTVTWSNTGTAEEGHNVIGDGLNSPVLHTGGTYSFTFKTPGTYSYACTIHPDMKGSVQVLARASSSSGKSGSGSSKGASGSGSSGSASSSGSSGTSGSASASSGSSGSSASGPSGRGGSSGDLPVTGGDSPAELLIGLLLIGTGAALRLQVRRRA